MKRLILVLLFATLLYTTWWLYRPLAEQPPATALSAAAENYQVEIMRDHWGIPHIKGARDADVSFGLAYAHAEDDFETIQETLAATRGVLARYRGKSAAATDYIVHLLNVWPTIRERYRLDVPADVKALAEAYVAGLNLYAAHNPEQTWPGLAPFRAEDVVAGFIFKTPFFYSLDKVLLDLFDDQRQAELALDPAPTEVAWQARPAGNTERGSNALAVNARRSGDDTTRLLINSHQPMTGPVAWYEAHLISDEGLDMTGGLFPGTPVILHGFNRNLGWANTVNHIDLADSYVLTRNPDNELQYWLDGQWEDFFVREIEIEVKLLGPFRYPAKRRVLESRHGPVIEGKNGSFALRYAGIGEIRQLEQYYRLNQANNFAEFMAAMRINALPSINYVYADRDDNIAFIHNAQYPKRAAGWDWSKDLPGDRSDLIWDGYRPFSEVPKLVNPQSGLVFNANNTPYSATDGPDNLRADDFPASMGLATDHTNRAWRIMELTDGESPMGKDQILALKFDTLYSPKSDHYQLIEKIMALDMHAEPRLQEAIELLRTWNRATDQQNPHAALAVLTLRKILRSDTPDDHSPTKLKGALLDTVDYLLGKFGRLDVAWGEVNRLIRGDVNMPLDGGPDILRAIYSFGLPAGEPAYATHGDTWMALVEWAPDGSLSADVVHQFGSATLDANSPHYADQAPLFARKQWRKALLDLDDIRAAAIQSYSPLDKSYSPSDKSRSP
ncbi:MAG: hypothetical protein HKN50_08215 [Gammaproteobacteria bacterium]|nr:hypothetical protein [Gammaproteobacteria bacterium]